jgi:polygalacturonase
MLPKIFMNKSFMPKALCLLSLFALTSFAHAANPAMPNIPSTVFKITDYGAVGDGVTDNATNIQKAIDTANAAGGGMVEVPAGTFVTGPFELRSSINLHLDAGATIAMLPLARYPGGTENPPTLITCHNIHDLEISGQGTFDGQGRAWWEAFGADRSVARPMIFNLFSADRVFIHDVTYKNPPNHHCGLRGNGGDITISNLTIATDYPSPNTDGLNFVGTNCIIEDCHISDGDDNIAMGSTGPLNDLVITNCVFGHGHGVSIGSGINGVTNLTVINCSFTDGDNGLRIKCPHRSGPIKDVNYFNLTMTNVRFPIVFYTYYNLIGNPDHVRPSMFMAAPLPVNASTPDWSDITISNLTATSPDIGGIIWGPAEKPIRDVTLIDVNITAPRTFDLFNVQGVKVIDSQFHFAQGSTFTLYNADLTVSNTVNNGQAISIDGFTSANSLALYNADASMQSDDAYGANPLALGGSTLTDNGNLTLAKDKQVNFVLGANAATVAVGGNLALNATLNITAASGFTATSYILFTYTGTLSGQPVLGSVPSGYNCTLDTTAPGIVKLVVTATQHLSEVKTVRAAQM